MGKNAKKWGFNPIKIYLHTNIFQFYQLALLSMISSIVRRKKIMITSAVFIIYETDKNFDEFWQWLIYSYEFINKFAPENRW